MSPTEIVEILKAEFADAITECAVEGDHPCAAVAADRLHVVARFLREDPRLTMNMLRCISACDGHPEPHIDIIYDLIAMRAPDTPAGMWENAGTIALRVRVPRDGGHVQTVSDIWPAADWHEREAYDLVGVTFDGHPDLRRILCPDDWDGHPLRKDYVFPKEFDGFPAAHEPESPNALPQVS